MKKSKAFFAVLALIMGAGCGNHPIGPRRQEVTTQQETTSRKDSLLRRETNGVSINIEGPTDCYLIVDSKIVWLPCLPPECYYIVDLDTIRIQCPPSECYIVTDSGIVWVSCP
jgi:hypothetical protein